MKLKSLAALMLALALLSPIAACAKDAASSASEFTSESATVESSASDTESPESAQPPESSAPESQSSAPEEPKKEPVEETPTAPVVTTDQYIKCTADSVNIRSGAGTNYSVLGSAEEGTVYAVTGKTGNWYKTYYRGKTAYIYASYVSVFTLKKSDDTDTEKVIAEGYKLIGTPYVYGAVRVHDGKGKLLSGFTAQKFDCSSLIQYVYYKGAGTLLDVNTRTQVLQGKYVSSSKLQRGDCIYFTNADRQYNTGIERIGHVALYLGNNYILHTSSDYARIEKISTQRWNYYIEARRFL